MCTDVVCVISQMKKKKGKKGAGGDGKRQVTNLREAPYSLKDGDVVGVVDRLEDPDGVADLSRADDEVGVKTNDPRSLLLQSSRFFRVCYKRVRPICVRNPLRLYLSEVRWMISSFTRDTSCLRGVKQ